MNIEYRKIFNKNYAIISDYNQTDYKECYRSKMLKNNHPANFLIYNTQEINGYLQFTYDISSKQSIYSFYENSKIDFKMICHIILSLNAAFETLHTYLLEADFMILDPKLIYMNLATKTIYFCYCPGEKHSFYDSVNELLCYILSKIDHNDHNSIILAYSLQQCSLNQNYTLNDLIEIVEKPVFRHTPKAIKTSPTAEKQMTPLPENETDPPKDLPLSENNPSFDITEPEETGTKFPFLICGLSLAALFYFGIYLQKIPLHICSIGFVCILLIGISIYFKDKLSFTSIFSDKSKNPLLSASEIFNNNQEKKHEQINLYQDNNFSDADISDESFSNDCTLSDDNLQTEQYYEDTVILGYRSGNNTPHLIYAGTEFSSDTELTSFPFIIGKMSQNVNMIIENPMISHIHARIFFKEGTYYIEDMNSSNGTYINNELIQPHTLTAIHPGDHITFSHLTYIFQ